MMIPSAGIYLIEFRRKGRLKFFDFLMGGLKIENGINFNSFVGSLSRLRLLSIQQFGQDTLRIIRREKF